MAEQTQHPIQFVRQQTGEGAPANMTVISFNEGERKIRALKALGLMWLIAAICILIPIAHFVLVPGFLIAGIIVARKRWQMPEEGIAAEGECPACGKTIRIDLEKNADLPQWRNCPECGQALELRSGDSP